MTSPVSQGTPVPLQAEFDLDRVDAATAFVATHGPSVIKPAASARGAGVTTGVHSRHDVVAASLQAARIHLRLLLNERINSSRQPSTFIEFLCECASTSCGGVIAMTEDEYRSVRADPTHFLVAPGHVFPGLDCIAEQDRRFVVVEKINHAAEFATAADRRST